MENNHLPDSVIPADKNVKPFNTSENYYVEEGNSFQLHDYINTILKRKWWIISCLAVALIIAIYYNQTLTPLFRGTATLQIIQDNPGSLVSSGPNRDMDTALYAVDRFYETQYKLLSSRAVAYKIVKIMDLIDRPEYKSLREDPKQSSQEIKRTVADAFLGQLEISPVKNSFLVDISYKSADPDLAMQVPNTICKEYLKFCMETRSQSYVLVREWLEGQLLQLAGKVESSEKKLLNQGRKEDFMGLEGDNNVIVNKYVELNKVLTTSQADRINKEAQYRQIQEKGIDAPLIANNGMIATLRKDIIGSEAKISSLKQTYGNNHPLVQENKAKLVELRSRLRNEVQRTTNTVKADYEIALRTENLLRSATESQKERVGKLQDGLVKYNILKRDMATSQQLYDALLARMKEASVASTQIATNASVIDAAELPLSPFFPNKSKNISSALFFGLVGGLCLAFLVEHQDSSIKNVTEVEKVYRIPALGVVPFSTDMRSAVKAGREVVLETVNQPKSMMSEAIHHIQASVMLSLSGSPPKIIMVCSANPAEGKSAISMNLAASLAMKNHKVVLIDADMRRPVLHRAFQLPQQPGLSNCLSGGSPLGEIIQPTEIPNLFVIAAGSIPPNPIPLLASQTFADLLNDLSREFQNIIIDTPPVVGFADARIISPRVDGTLVVFKHHSTSREAGRLAIQLLHSSNGRILGAVLNMVKKRKFGYGGYYYNYYKSYDRYYKHYNSE